MTTNYERIKQMSIEEMVEEIARYTDCPVCPANDICSENKTTKQCPTVVKQWLESEAEDE